MGGLRGGKGRVMVHTWNWKLSLSLQESRVCSDELLRLHKKPRISIIPSSEVIPTPSRLLVYVLHLCMCFREVVGSPSGGEIIVAFGFATRPLFNAAVVLWWYLHRHRELKHRRPLLRLLGGSWGWWCGCRVVVQVAKEIRDAKVLCGRAREIRRDLSLT